ncbi:MAG TPA: hypothetical protein VKV06_00625 [Acidimicrobiales bacterium]|nr:hypothetical protein [Acidimicrobiales bacterium]
MARFRLVSIGAVAAVVRRPELWPVALRVAWRTAPPEWWRAVPPRPRPPASYVKMRHEAMWGDDPAARLGPDELIGYLRWCARMRALAR